MKKYLSLSLAAVISVTAFASASYAASDRLKPVVKQPIAPYGASKTRPPKLPPVVEGGPTRGPVSAPAPQQPGMPYPGQAPTQ